MIQEMHLKEVNNHWAVKAVGEEKRDYALNLANTILVQKAVGSQLKIELTLNEEDIDLLNRLETAYELAAIEGLNTAMSATSDKDELRNQCTAGAWQAFSLLRLLDPPTSKEEQIFHVLHLSSLAYCGDRWSDIKRWFNEHKDLLDIPSVDNIPWDKRLLYHLFKCWISLFRKDGWDDLSQVSGVISKLRQEQKEYESGVLNGTDQENQIMAYRLIALYHWAKVTELLATYMLQGEPNDILTRMDKHYESAKHAASMSRDIKLEMLLTWLHAASHQMVQGSIWWVLKSVNSRVTTFVEHVTKHRGLFELLPPQRAALQEQGLLDPAAIAIAVELPTSGGKTLLAQFRILQALNQFDQNNGWVAYVAPTRALTAQITRRLRRDFEGIGIQVEQLTGAVEIDAFEESLLTGTNSSSKFDVLVATPEKLQLVLRNKKVSRPLALIVMDEAHNIEDKSRGLRIELLLATIKREYTSAKFLLLMPYVEKAETVARWLSGGPDTGRSISISTTPWQPNERIVGLYWAETDQSVKGGWRLRYETLLTTPKAIHLTGKHDVDGVRPLKHVPRSKVLNRQGQQVGLSKQTAAMAKVFSDRGTSIAVASTIRDVWSMARDLVESTDKLDKIPDDIALVQRFLSTEVSPEFELIDMLSHGIGVHHAGLSDETRSLIEWLTEQGSLRVLCATTTIAQGINFPVSSIFLASNKHRLDKPPYRQEMSPREFWNLAGRAGRMGHDSVGVIGLAQGTDRNELIRFFQYNTGELVSRLVSMLNDLEKQRKLEELDRVIMTDEWADFRCYVAHLWNEKEGLDAVLGDTEQLLRNTYGYSILVSQNKSDDKAKALLNATRKYASKLAQNPGNVKLADMTGFSPEGVKKAFKELGQLENKLNPSDWTPEGLFGEHGRLAELYGVMLNIPQIKDSLQKIAGDGPDKKRIASITNAWVSGKSIQDIARVYFQGDDTQNISEAVKAIYRTIVNIGTWGLSALSKMSGFFDSLTEYEKKQINILPAMIYHGVQTEHAVLMRMNAVPRSIAETLGQEYSRRFGSESMQHDVYHARMYLHGMTENDWTYVCPPDAYMSGGDYKKIWEILSGES